MNAEIRFYLALVLRRLPVMTALFLLAASIGVALAFKLPTTYRTEATLLVESAQIDPDLARSTVQTDPAEQLEIIERRLMTRTNLIDIADSFDVFGAERAGMSADEVVEAMRQQTSIDRRSGRDQATIMEIRFVADSPRIVTAVVNEYVNLVLEENVRTRTNQAGDTLAFFEQEVERLDADLARQSQRILEFKNANTDALPETLEYRLDRQAALQERINLARRDRASLLDQRDRIVQLFEATGRVDGAGRQLSPEEAELAQLRSELQAALAVYSDTNPKVRVLQSRIASLEAQLAGAAETGDGAPVDPASALVQLQTTEIDDRIAVLDEEIATASAELERLEETVRRTPQNAIALEGLERDYTTIQSQYENARSALAAARTGERIEAGAKGERIRVIEQASTPTEPYSPDRPKIIALSVGVGLALAGGYFLLMELLNGAVRRPAEIVSGLGIKPLATIPYIESRAHRIWRRSLRVAAFLVVLLGVPATLWAIDTYYLPLELLAERVIDQFGLG